MTHLPNQVPNDHPSVTRGSPLLGVPPDALYLRAGGSGLEGQIVQISATKCTIGAAPRCTLRLGQAGVSPLHCVVLRGAIGTIVRRWSPQTRLNDRAFTDAPLRVGDRLRCGPVELEVLPPPKTQSASRPVQQSDVPSAADGSLPASAPPASGPPCDIALARLRTAVAVARRRARQFIAQLRQARIRLMQLDAMLKSEQARGEWAAEHLQQREAIHTTERNDLASRNAQLKMALCEAESAQRRLADEQAAESAQADQRQQAAVRDLQAELARSQAQLDSQQRTVRDQHDEIARLRADLERQETDCRERLAIRQQQLDQADQRNDLRQQAIQSLRDELERTRQLRPEANPNEPLENTAVAAPTPDRPAHQEPPAGPSCEPELGDGDSIDEETIEAYLAQLLCRARRESTATDRPALEPGGAVPGAPDRYAYPIQAAPAAGAGDPQTNDARCDPVRRSWVLTGIGKLLVATAGILAAGLILAMLPWRSATRLGIDVLLGIVALLIAAVWGVQGAMILRRVRRAKAVRSIGHGPWQAR